MVELGAPLGPLVVPGGLDPWGQRHLTVIWHFTCMGCVQLSRSSVFVFCSNQGINQWITPKGLARWPSPLRTRNEANGRGKYQNPRQTHASCALPGPERTPQVGVPFLGCPQEKHYTSRTLQAAPCKPLHWTAGSWGHSPLQVLFLWAVYLYPPASVYPNITTMKAQRLEG